MPESNEFHPDGTNISVWELGVGGWELSYSRHEAALPPRPADDRHRPPDRPRLERQRSGREKHTSNRDRYRERPDSSRSSRRDADARACAGGFHRRGPGEPEPLRPGPGLHRRPSSSSTGPRARVCDARRLHAGVSRTRSAAAEAIVRSLRPPHPVQHRLLRCGEGQTPPRPRLHRDGGRARRSMDS